jgi:phosphoribosylglycinamide formyltransferase-1
MGSRINGKLVCKSLIPDGQHGEPTNSTALTVDHNRDVTRRNPLLAMNVEACIIPGAMGRLKIGVLGSGKGSNFRAILSEIQTGRLDAEAVLVMSDVENAGILDLACGAGIPSQVIREPKFRTKLSPEVESDVAARLREAGAELVVLAGYMRMVKAPLLEGFPRRVINIHPSLLPAFPGLESWRQALDAGVEKSGCTVHFVDAGMDTGEIIAQAAVPVLPGDTAESLHARIQVEEHKIYPSVVARFVSGELP